MNKQHLSIILATVAKQLAELDFDKLDTFDANVIERHLSSAFHDVGHVVELSDILAAYVQTPAPEFYWEEGTRCIVVPGSDPVCDDVPARLVPRCLGPDCLEEGGNCPSLPAAPKCDASAATCTDEPTPPTQRTGEEEPTKTQVDQLKPEPNIPLCGEACPNFAWLRDHAPTTCSTGCKALTTKEAPAD